MTACMRLEEQLYICCNNCMQAMSACMPDVNLISCPTRKCRHQPISAQVLMHARSVIFQTRHARSDAYDGALLCDIIHVDLGIAKDPDDQLAQPARMFWIVCIEGPVPPKVHFLHHIFVAVWVLNKAYSWTVSLAQGTPPCSQCGWRLAHMYADARPQALSTQDPAVTAHKPSQVRSISTSTTQQACKWCSAPPAACPFHPLSFWRPPAHLVQFPMQAR